jgi:hypothetical protein
MTTPSVGVIKFNSVGAGYSAINQLFALESLELLEMSPLGENSQILVRGPFDKVNSFRKSLRQADLERTAIIYDADDKIVKTYLSLESKNPKKFIFVFESNFLGEIFEVARQLLDAGCELCEIRFIRNTTSPCYISATGESLDLIKSIFLKYEIEKKKVSLLENLNPGLIQFLSLEP